MEPFIGEIRMFGGDFAPKDWALCDGRLLYVGQASELFSLLHTYYGGDGVSTFGVPDLRGRAPVGAGQGKGTSGYGLGQMAGSETVVLSQQQLPAHNHSVNAVSTAANKVVPTNFHPSAIIDPSSGSGVNFYSDADTDVTMKSDTISTVGNNQPVGIVQPVQAVTFIIALKGIYPSRP